jgi:sporulation protein YlmC with PRC-barrel domain
MEDGSTIFHPLITSSDVNGSEVFNTSGDRIGTIDHLMIDKKSGKVAYAIMAFGGFLGLGSDYYPIPWNALKYDTNLEGYVTGITQAQLENAPKSGADWQRDRDWETRAYDYYGVQPYWL